MILSKRIFVILTGAFLTLLLLMDSGQEWSSPPFDFPQTHPDEYLKHDREIRTANDESRPSYDPGYRINALTQVRAARKGGQAPLPWSERGPGNVGGRTRAIIVDINDPTHSTWFVGSVSGGIWKTVDKGLKWEPLTDGLSNIAINSLAQSVSNPSVMYAGTGEGFRNVDAAIGDGMFKSTDGGNEWIPLSATTSSFDFLFVNRLLVDPSNADIVLAATNGGIMRSEDGGASWTTTQEGASSAGFYQIVAEPGNFNVQYASDPAAGILKSTDAGLTWSESHLGLSQAGDNSRIELDVSPANPARLFAMVESSDGVDPIYVSNNRGELWVAAVQVGNTETDVAGTQGWYDLMVKAHPFDEDVAFLGGVALYRFTVTGSQTAKVFLGATENGTDSFMDYVNFGAQYLGGGMRLGIDEPESTITLEKMVSVEVRFGSGRSQKAHRFTPPDQSGVDFADYPYQDYVDVPFEVWDTDNNRQLMVSFRDREDNGAFDLSLYDQNDTDREYVLIHARPYNATTPDPLIAQDGGIVSDMAYFFWPVLADDATWDPSNLPTSSLAFTWDDREAASASVSLTGSGVHADQHVMVTTPTGPSTFQIVLGNDGGVFYSGDGGSNWVDRDRGYNTAQFYGVDKKPGVDAYIGGTQDNGSWRSFGNAQPFQSWFNAGGGDGFDTVWHKQNDQKMITTSQWNWFQRSLNGGQSFTNGTGGLKDTGSRADGGQFLTVIAQDPDDSDILFTVGESGIWKSVNFAESWNLRSIPADDWGFSGNGKVAVSHVDGNIVWAGYEMDTFPSSSDDDGKLHVSSDGGNTFTSIPSPDSSPGRLSGLATSYEHAETVYVTFSASNRSKLLRSTDLGQTWEDLSGFQSRPGTLVSANGFPDVAVYDVLDFPSNPVIWAATEIGLVESMDDGLTWHHAENGLPAVSIWQLKLLDEQVVAATHGRGVWTLPNEAVPISVEETGSELPTSLSVRNVYPNPVRQSATIEWSTDSPGAVRINAFDIQGREVALLWSGMAGPGDHQVSWDATDLATGAYFIRIEQGGKLVTQQILRVK